MSIKDVANSAAKVQKEVASPPPNALSTLPDTSGRALMAVLDQSEAGNGPLFPTLTVSGGTGGGMFQPLKGTPTEIGDKMPQGRKPVQGMFIGYRSSLAAWPKDFGHRDEGGKPVWRLACSSMDTALSTALEAASRAYQFTAGANKPKFDYDVSGVGHIKPVLELLLWSKDLGGLMVVQSTASYESWLEGLRSLGRLADPTTKMLGRFPVNIRVQSLPRENKAKTLQWQVHVFTFDVPVNNDGKSVADGYEAWKPSVGPELQLQVVDWLQANDAKPTEEALLALDKAKALK